MSVPTEVDAQVARRSFWRVWLLTVALLFPFCLLWAAAQPMFAGMDEAAHIATAQGFSRGDFSEPFESDGLPMEEQGCYNPSELITADCANLVWGADGTEVRTKTDDYPPGFHAVAAIPAFFVSGLGGTYVMRAWMAAVCCAIIGWAAGLLLRPGRGRWPVLGLVMGVLPMSMSVMSTVNPSGMAVALTALAVSGLVVRFRWDDRRPMVWVAVGVGLVGLLLVRRDGLAWVAVIGAMFAPIVLADSSRRRGAMAALRSAIGSHARASLAIGVATLVLAVVATVLFVVPVLSKFFERSEVGGNGSRWQGLGEIQLNMQQMVGILGRIHGFVGYELYTMVMIGGGLLVALAVASGRRDWSWATVIGVFALLATPVAFGFVSFPYFQGRYLLPIWVALMLVASVGVALAGLPHGIESQLQVGLASLWWIIHLFSFWQALRRYSVTRIGGWWDVVSDPAWEPPMVSNGALFVLLVVLVAVPTPLIARQLMRAVD